MEHSMKKNSKKKTYKAELKVEKVIKKKNDKLYVKCKGCDESRFS